MEYDNNLKYDPTDFQTSISNYILTIEELCMSIKENQSASDNPSYYLSLQILGQILQQMKSLMERRLSYNALAELLSNEDLIFSQSSQQSSFSAFSLPFTIYGNMKEGDQINLVTEEETLLQAQRELGKNKKKPEFVVDNTDPPPPWKPKK